MNQKYRVALVDDVDHAREELKSYLQDHSDIEVVAEFEDIRSAWGAITKGGVDGVFLDIQFVHNGGGETDGFELAKKIVSAKLNTWIIMLTEFKDYAVTAFNDIKPKPVDYLLKDGTLQEKLANALNEVRKIYPLGIKIKVGVLKSASIYRIKPIEIYWIQFVNKVDMAKGKVWRDQIHLRLNRPNNDKLQNNALENVFLLESESSNDSKVTPTKETLKRWSDLNLPGFVQISKTAIVNMAHIAGYEVDPDRPDYYRCFFKDIPDKLPMGGKTTDKNCYLSDFIKEFNMGSHISG